MEAFTLAALTTLLTTSLAAALNPALLHAPRSDCGPGELDSRRRTERKRG
jgi:hypothetical protein